MVTPGSEERSRGSPPASPVNRKSGPRSRLVCSRCHEKKIKCDIQACRNKGSDQCRNCSVSGSECWIRPSRRGLGKRGSKAKQRNTAAIPTGDAIQDREQPVYYDFQGPEATITAAPVPELEDLGGEPGEVALSLLQLNAGATQSVNGHTPMVGTHSLIVPSLPSTDGVYSPDNDVSPQAGAQAHHVFPTDTGGYPPAQTGRCVNGGGAAGESATVEGEGSQPDQRPSYLGDSGYMHIFGRGTSAAITPSLSTGYTERGSELDVIPPALQESYLDTYFEYAYVWCPVLDREMLQPSAQDMQGPAAGLVLLRHALALCGNHIQPPLVQHALSASHYRRAKTLFYEADDINPIMRIAAVMLFYWWSTGPPDRLSMDANWWWTGAAIRLAQEIGLHREPRPGQELMFGATVGLRRRIWWTLFARERITGLSQGRPCVIDPDYCDVKMISVHDFPDPSDIRSDILVRWVKLTEIMGRISKLLCVRNSAAPVSTAPLARELVNWAQSLPAHLQLQIGSGRTRGFNRDVHGLNLVYLATISLLNLRRGDTPGRMIPEAGPPAIVGASCVARIFEDYMARGSVRFLAGQAGWYIAVSLLALLHARGVPHLREHADRDIKMLRAALGQMAALWHSSKTFQVGFDRLIAMEPPPSRMRTPEMGGPSGKAAFEGADDINCLDYFPYVTASSSPLIGAVLAEDQVMPFEELQWPIDPTVRLHEFFTCPDTFTFDDFDFNG